MLEMKQQSSKIHSVGDEAYVYDKNGNMIEDKYKKIKITYNYLNLPLQIEYKSGENNFIHFVYSATGEKLQKIVTVEGKVQSKTDYINGIEYKNDVLQRIAHTEGSLSRQDDDKFLQEYVLRDHLGNTRVTFTDADNDGNINEKDIKQINMYYPFGLNAEGNWNGAAGSNKYQYNGKSWEDDFGLGWNDYGARFYDPAGGRWLGIDALAEEFINLSPYNYAGNNPVKNIDIDGRIFIFSGSAAVQASLQSSLNQYFGVSNGISISEGGYMTMALTDGQLGGLNSTQRAVYNQINLLNNQGRAIEFKLIDENNSLSEGIDVAGVEHKLTSAMVYIDSYNDGVLDVSDIEDMATTGGFGQGLVGPSLFHAFYEQFLGVTGGGKTNGVRDLAYAKAHGSTVDKEFEVLNCKQTNDMITPDGKITIRDIVFKTKDKAGKDATQTLSYKIELDAKTSRIKTIGTITPQEREQNIKDNKMIPAKD